MSINRNQENPFVGYEYKDVTLHRSMEPLYADGYPHFGWSLEGIASAVNNLFSVVMKFKRDRKIRNKTELTRLQRQFEACVAEIEALERSKQFAASAFAYVLGVAGTAFMAGSLFAYLAGLMPLCVLFAIPGFAGWIFPYFVFCHVQKRKTAEVTPLIDKKHDEIYETCEKANSLLA